MPRSKVFLVEEDVMPYKEILSIGNCYKGKEPLKKLLSDDSFGSTPLEEIQRCLDDREQVVIQVNALRATPLR